MGRCTSILPSQGKPDDTKYALLTQIHKNSVDTTDRTSRSSIPRTPCYLSKSEVAVVFTETSYPLSFRAIKSIFELVSTDLKSHPNNDEVISSSNLWYPGDYPYNNTELFVRMTQADFTMTWGEWKNASTILAFFYTRFSTVQLDFEIKVAMGRSAKSLASGRVSLYDRGETETE